MPRSSESAFADMAGTTAANPVLDGILQAIARQRLAPGAKLNEELLGEVFGVSRTIVRSALQRLQARGLVSLQVKRTARIAAPSIKQARDVFAVRKLIEPAVVADVARTATPALMRTLRRNHAEEHRTRQAGDRIEATRLAGEFHVLLAQACPNELLREMVERTVEQTFLISVLYQSPATPACVKDEHEALLAAIEKRDPEAAARAMKDHVAGIESRMLLDETAPRDVDIRSAFSGLVPPQR
jgi:DNA-binding GntR family transcriptional regulator